MFHVQTPGNRSAYLLVGCFVGLGLAAAAHAQTAQPLPAASSAGALALGQPEASPVLNPRHPETYVVQPGDTLWDIAATFLRDPWYWPEIWQINPDIENPHLIFPGDVLSLAYLDDGRPVVSVTERGPLAGSGLVERLSPRVRAEPLEEAIQTIPFETLRAFLSRPAILDRSELDTLPYIVAHPEGLLGSAGHDVYVRGTDAGEGAVFNFVHPGEALVDPDDGTVVGYQGLYVGQGRVRRAGDPSTVFMTESAREALIGDYLVTEDSVAPATFLPRAPEEAVDGRIISVLDGVSLIGQYQVIVVNRGARHGLQPGHVLSVYRTGEVIRDPVRGNRQSGEKVRLPDELAGTTMVFRTFDRISYALVMEATNEIHILDTVRNPE
ncbi:MAG TPA: LysM domain-containing protein [Gammaproteobacteria bacterium]|jgi:hypothetical protein